MLLVFALMVGPPAAAQRLVQHLAAGLALTIGLAILETWGGIALAFATDWPTTFWIVLLSCLVYFASIFKPAMARSAAPG